MSNYYGSELADRAVHAWQRECERIGWQYDEPGRHGVEIKRSKGRETIVIRNRYGGIEAMYDERPDGGLRKLNLVRLPARLN